MRKLLSIAPGIGFFIYMALSLEVPRISSLMGVLALSIAVGSVCYFHFNAPAGRRSEETLFGISGKYKNPVHGTIIPNKVASIVIGLIVSICLFGLLFYHYGY